MSGKRHREEECDICGHFHDYLGGEKCGICGHVLAPNHGATASTRPTEILPGFLYVGSYDHASRLEMLKAMDISHVLNTVPTCQELYKNTLTYRTITSSPPDFQECFEFLDGARNQQKKVLVHCMTGITKSCAVVIGYLMKLRGWTLSESHTWVHDRHPTCNLNSVDSELLQKLEWNVHGKSSTGYQMHIQGSQQGRQQSGPFAWDWRETPAPQQAAPVFQQPTGAPSLLQNVSGGPFVFGQQGQFSS